jgi:hypothetical protein
MWESVSGQFYLAAEAAAQRSSGREREREGEGERERERERRDGAAVAENNIELLQDGIMRSS